MALQIMINITILHWIVKLIATYEIHITFFYIFIIINENISRELNLCQGQ